MVQLGFVKPNNDVIQGDFPHGSPFMQLLQIKTVANMYPGRLVIRDTTDYQVGVGGASGHVIGWLGYGEAPTGFKPATRTTIYAVNDTAPVHSGGGFRVRASLAIGQNVVKGQRLMPAAAGELTDYVAATDDAVAIAAESVDATGAAASIWVESLI
jgi:hypothetical protein